MEEHLRPSVSSDLAAALDRGLRSAIASACAIDEARADPQVKSSATPKFGDFQANFAMALAKSLGKPPRDVAQAVVAAATAPLSSLCEKMEIAGPGFVNITLRASAISDALDAMDCPTLGVPTVAGTKTIAVDLCGVNVAKQMHVGHLRATIIGDTIARMHERLGWRVYRQNHLGDWGLPIAMTLASLKRHGVDLGKVTLDDLNSAYRRAQAEGEADPTALADAHDTLRKLQAGDEATVADWQRLIAVTMAEVFATAAILGVDLSERHSRGESFFRQRLGPTVAAFVDAGIAERDAGALIVRFPDRERPLLIQKSDGTSLYSTTDLAAVRYRVQELGADLVVYCVDARQRDHFKDVFDAVVRIGWTHRPGRPDARLVHVPFGAVLGEDKKPLKTRSGENVTLVSLLDEATARGRREVHARAADPEAHTATHTHEELDAIGQAVGIAAIKYADLSGDVGRDYVFDLDRMVSFEGDTGPYLQYAHARIAGILAKAGTIDSRAPLSIAAPEERALALHLLRYGPALESAAASLAPNRLAAYIYELANTFNAFYQACPVLKGDDAAIRASRLRLCALTRRVLSDALAVMGITAPMRM